MKNLSRNGERGVALFFSVFALLLLTGIAATLVFMATTETQINSNFRQEQMAFFAAKAGIEEARARMMPSDPSSINTALTPLPTAAPTSTNNSVIYIVNPGATLNSVQPWSNSASTYGDDEICHEGYGASFGAVVAPDIRCALATLPAGAYTSYNSALPYSGTANALPYKWVRLAPKLNSSVSYLTGAGATATTSNYLVNTAATTSTLICWDGAEELPLKAPATICSQMLTAAGAPMTNVYLMTALGVSPTGARKMVQSEVALSPTPPFPYGLFGTSTSCNPAAIAFNGSNASTNSYTTAGGGTYSTTQSATGGDVGTNGQVDVQNGQIGGIVGVLQPPPLGNGTCATPVTVGSQGTMVGSVACPSGNPLACYVPQPYVFPTPPLPNPLPPNTSYSPPSCPGGKKAGNCMVPGTYGNISTNGTLTLAPGTYNINSLAMAGNGAIVVSPPGALTLNIAGCGDATCTAANALSNPVAIAGNGITDDTIPNDFTINYPGPGSVSVTGNGDVTAILNAPNAALTQKGNGNWYGSILVSTASIGGNAFFHYDRNAALAPANNGYYTMISFREVPY